MATLFWLKQKLSRSFSYLLIIQSDFCGLLVTRLTEFWHIVGVIYAMWSSGKYPYLPHGRELFWVPLPSPLWKFRLSFIHFFKFFGLVEPPTPQEIPIPSVGGVWIFSGTEQFSCTVSNRHHFDSEVPCIHVTLDYFETAHSAVPYYMSFVRYNNLKFRRLVVIF